MELQPAVKLSASFTDGENVLGRNRLTTQADSSTHHKDHFDNSNGRYISQLISPRGHKVTVAHHTIGSFAFFAQPAVYKSKLKRDNKYEYAKNNLYLIFCMQIDQTMTNLFFRKTAMQLTLRHEKLQKLRSSR